MKDDVFKDIMIRLLCISDETTNKIVKIVNKYCSQCDRRPTLLRILQGAYQIYFDREDIRAILENCPELFCSGAPMEIRKQENLTWNDFVEYLACTD